MNWLIDSRVQVSRTISTNSTEQLFCTDRMFKTGDFLPGRCAGLIHSTVTEMSSNNYRGLPSMNQV